MTTTKMTPQEAEQWVMQTLESIETRLRWNQQAMQAFFEWTINSDPTSKEALRRFLSAQR